MKRQECVAWMENKIAGITFHHLNYRQCCYQVTYGLSKYFLSNIRKYSSCFQMTLFGARKLHVNIQSVTPNLSTCWISTITFKRRLQIFEDLFIGNTKNQIDQRCPFSTGIKRAIVAALQILFDQHNELILFRIS